MAPILESSQTANIAITSEDESKNYPYANFLFDFLDKDDTSVASIKIKMKNGAFAQGTVVNKGGDATSVKITQTDNAGNDVYSPDAYTEFTPELGMIVIAADTDGFSHKITIIVPEARLCKPERRNINVAFMGGEVANLKSSDYLEISFNPLCISWCEFLKIFYNCSNDFKVSQHLDCYLQRYIAFNLQREEGPAFDFNLKDRIIETWTQELKELSCKPIDRCSYMKLSKQIAKLRTLADVEKLCKVKIEAVSRSQIVDNMIMCTSNPGDTYILNVGVQISAEQEKGDVELTPILLNFNYEIKDLFIYLTPGTIQLDRERLLFPPYCECCPQKWLCIDKKPCDPIRKA